MDEFDDRTYPFREDMRFQLRTWRVERVAWAVMGLLLIAALAGLFFHGPLSTSVVRSADDSLAIDYQRFAHKTTMTHFVVRIGPPLRDQVLLRLSPSFTGMYDIEALEPRPLHSSSGSYGLEYVFGRSAAGDLAVHIAARPKRFGFVSVHVEVEGRGAVNIAQFVYP